jgi:chromosome segregation ATPase
MKTKFRRPLLIISLLLVAALNQGCEDSSKSNELNQKIEALSTKLDSVLQNQATLQKQIETQKTELQQHEDSIVSRVDHSDYYYTTNLLSHVNENILRLDLSLEDDLKNDFKNQMSGIEKQLKPRYGSDFETLGDKVEDMKQKVDRIQRSLSQIELDNTEIKNDTQKIKSRLGIIY